MNTLLWLRRDLRLHDHAALAAAMALGGGVQPVFVFDTDILARFSNPHDRRLTFLAHTLCDMHATLKKMGGNMWVFHGKAEHILPALSHALSATIVAAEDFEPATIARDQSIAGRASLSLVKDHLIASPKDILKNDGTPFKVFTPYSKAWLAKLSPSDYGSYPSPRAGVFASVALPVGFTLLPLEAGAEALLAQIGYKQADISQWPVAGASERLQYFMQHKAANYGNTRDMLAIEGTSRISPYLRFGLVSVREAVRQAYEAGALKYLSELIWREFYAMILYHYPESIAQEWNPNYRRLQWSHNEAHFSAWKEGCTGYPVVDAAMRELLTTGFMHNRARMIVASFLTKDLQLDWRLGESHFAQHLMDYELASNVGGWQWSASTGTDAQPYFRIFNPYLQSERFDPAGDYIRRYVPELAHIKEKTIHHPLPLERGNYPAPMVDHGEAREKTLALFKAKP